ncbi:MAG: hypothetical protein JHC33_03505 [Ignisphaera sp.]|nr:hypothetical protein [Ignisphaera sp.]
MNVIRKTPTKAKKVIDTETNIIFDTIKDAALANNMTNFNLRNRLIGKVKNNTNLRLLTNE